MSLRTLIVDDEPLARERMRRLLAITPGVEVVGECDNCADTLAAIATHQPDLIFLDIQLAGGSGMDLARQIAGTRRLAIVFATAHERFALGAFDVDAADYLLKPFEHERLQLAVQRAQRFLQLDGENTPAPAPASPAARSDEPIPVRSDNRLILLRPDDVVWAEAADNYVTLHLTRGRVMIRETMNALEARLDPQRFFRANRSAIVNVQSIREIRPTSYGDYEILLREGSSIKLSRKLRHLRFSFFPDKAPKYAARS